MIQWYYIVFHIEFRYYRKCNLKTIEEESFDDIIEYTNLDKSWVSITISDNKINIIYVFYGYIKENI